MGSFFSEIELNKIGFKKMGKNVLISKKASIYGAGNISIGDNVRIDDFCILSGKVEIHSFVHIAAYCSFYGGDKGITIGDYSTTSSRCAIYALSDDYSGNSMVNPMIDGKFRSLIEKEVLIGKHCIIGSNSTILPGSILEEGVAIGAHSLVKGYYKEWSIYHGVIAKLFKERSKRVIELEKEFRNSKEKK